MAKVVTEGFTWLICPRPRCWYNGMDNLVVQNVDSASSSLALFLSYQRDQCIALHVPHSVRSIEKCVRDKHVSTKRQRHLLVSLYSQTRRRESGLIPIHDLWHLYASANRV